MATIRISIFLILLSFMISSCSIIDFRNRKNAFWSNGTLIEQALADESASGQAGQLAARITDLKQWLAAFDFTVSSFQEIVPYREGPYAVVAMDENMQLRHIQEGFWFSAPAEIKWNGKEAETRAAELKAKGYSAEVLELSTLRPWIDSDSPARASWASWPLSKLAETVIADAVADAFPYKKNGFTDETYRVFLTRLLTEAYLKERLGPGSLELQEYRDISADEYTFRILTEDLWTQWTALSGSGQDAEEIKKSGAFLKERWVKDFTVHYEDRFRTNRFTWVNEKTVTPLTLFRFQVNNKLEAELKEQFYKPGDNMKELIIELLKR